MSQSTGKHRVFVLYKDGVSAGGSTQVWIESIGHILQNNYRAEGPVSVHCWCNITHMQAGWLFLTETIGNLQSQPFVQVGTLPYATLRKFLLIQSPNSYSVRRSRAGKSYVLILQFLDSLSHDVGYCADWSPKGVTLPNNDNVWHILSRPRMPRAPLSSSISHNKKKAKRNKRCHPLRNPETASLASGGGSFLMFSIFYFLFLGPIQMKHGGKESRLSKIPFKHVCSSQLSNTYLQLPLEACTENNK